MSAVTQMHVVLHHSGGVDDDATANGRTGVDNRRRRHERAVSHHHAVSQRGRWCDDWRRGKPHAGHEVDEASAHRAVTDSDEGVGHAREQLGQVGVTPRNRNGVGHHLVEGWHHVANHIPHASGRDDRRTHLAMRTAADDENGLHLKLLPGRIEQLAHARVEHDVFAEPAIHALPCAVPCKPQTKAAHDALRQ